VFSLTRFSGFLTCGGLLTFIAGMGCGSDRGVIHPPPALAYVFLVVEENGNPAMPYLNGLISKYGLARQYYANVHPSIGNYFMLTDGKLKPLTMHFPARFRTTTPCAPGRQGK